MSKDSLYSDDLAPVPESKRTWNTWNYAALWISMSLCIPTYMLASSLIEGGMNWWQAILTIFLGNTIVLIPMVLNGHAGAKYGIPFPVLARASFGVRLANLPAILRAIVACGWFGIQTWIGGFALYQMFRLWWPGLETLPQIFPQSFDLATGPAITFFLFWLLNMFIVYLGVESIRKLLVFKAIFLPLAALALLFWAIEAGNGLGPILAQPAKFSSSGEFWNFFFPALTGMVGFWATLSLNIPDFTRYAKSQKAQVTGQAIGLPTSMTLFSFIGVAVTSATFIVYGETIWDPIVLAGKFEDKLLVSIAMIAVAISTLATNIAANIVSPANDFANLSPSKINFRTGGYITGVIGILIFPWKLIADPNGYIFTWLIAYSSLLGPIGGIMIADYFFIRKKQLDVQHLYSLRGFYTYHNGYNYAALVALLAGILPNVPGFLVTIHLVPKENVPVWIASLYHYAWFVGFAVSFFVYLIWMKKEKITMDEFMNAAIAEAQQGLSEGGIPIGSVLVRDGMIIGRGHNKRVQDSDPVTHAEIDCLRNAGRVGNYRDAVLYSTLMPCYLCAGAVVQFGIKKVYAGEDETFLGAKAFMESYGVEVINLNSTECKEMMKKFIAEKPELWFEDIGEL